MKSSVTLLRPKEVIHVIKAMTAHPRISLLAGSGIAGLVGAKVLGIELTEVASQAGTSLSYAYKYIKAAGIVSAFLGLMFILFKFNILGLKMAPENSAFMVARRGKIARHKNGDVVLYESGRNRWHVINYRHLAPVHFGDRFVPLGTREFVVDGITWKADFTLQWRIPNDKRLIELTVTSVSDRNWWDGEFNQLSRAIGEKATGQLGPILTEARLNDKGLPVFDEMVAKTLLDQAVRPYGATSYALIMSPVTRTDAQQAKDGSVAIANAIAGVSLPSVQSLFQRIKRLLG